MSKVKQLIPNGDVDNLPKNAAEFADEVRKGNVESCYLAYRRKDGSMRTFMVTGEDGAKYYFMLSVALHDSMESYTERQTIKYRWEEDE